MVVFKIFALSFFFLTSCEKNPSLILLEKNYDQSTLIYKKEAEYLYSFSEKKINEIYPYLLKHYMPLIQINDSINSFEKQIDEIDVKRKEIIYQKIVKSIRNKSTKNIFYNKSELFFKLPDSISNKAILNDLHRLNYEMISDFYVKNLAIIE
jgi:hypothetical protein